MSSKKTIIAIAITTAALTVGSVGFASASSKSTTKISTTRTTARVTGITNPMGSMKGRPGSEVASVLAALVTKGTITQAQADAIIAAITAAQIAEHGVAGGPKGIPNADRLAMDKLVSDAIGVDTATIKSRLMAGESLATIAGAKKDALIAALVADQTKRIDAAVTAGKITAAQGTAMKATLLAHVTEGVNATRGAGFSGAPKGGKGGREHGGMGERDHAPMGVAPKIPAPTA
ncbi:MAG: hypothetical protein NTZ06_06190 [Actinobacteria bacterium]|nr:hypothetical protein [Actinomycetota bacterium]